MEDIILKILQELCPYEEITADTELLEEGLLDSMGIMLLIERLEKELSVSIPAEELEPEDFSDTPAIAEMIERVAKR